jgi:polyisoprenoid-binding protein YceI
MKKLVVILIAGLLPFFASAQTKWNVDNTHSSVKFTVTHLVISEVEGSFKTFTGNISSANPDFTDAAIDFTVDVNSINTDNEMRDKHLKSPDFFDTEKFGQMTFKSTSFKKVDENKYKLVGNLTIKDVTKSVTFDVTYGGTAKDPWGNTKAGFKASTTIDRFDYGLKWNAATEAGGAVVSKEVAIQVRMELTQAK